MAELQRPDTHQKALTINLDPTIYGTLAEIGAGQEVARWFLQAGGASGTVAKTISAYDMTFSDAIYGKVGRYVSRERVEGMLDHEYRLLLDRLAASRGAEARFFVFADTISARNYAGTNECHGWIGIRFQTEPGVEASDVVLHVSLKDNTNLQQQRAVGVLGVNLVHAVYHRRDSLEDFLAAVFEELSLERLEVDLIAVRGPAFTGVDERSAVLELVRAGLAEAVVFPGVGSLVPPDELLRKRPLVLEPGVFAKPVPAQRAMLEAARRRLTSESGRETEDPLVLFAMTDRRPDETTTPTTGELGERLRFLLDMGYGVLFSRRPEIYRIVQFALRYTSAPVRLAISALTLAEIFHAPNYDDLAGRLMQGLAQLFAVNVRVYVYPIPRAAAANVDPAVAAWLDVAGDDDSISLATLDLPSPHVHLFRYLTESGFLQPL